MASGEGGASNPKDQTLAESEVHELIKGLRAVRSRLTKAALFVCIFAGVCQHEANLLDGDSAFRRCPAASPPADAVLARCVRGPGAAGGQRGLQRFSAVVTFFEHSELLVSLFPLRFLWMKCRLSYACAWDIGEQPAVDSTWPNLQVWAHP